jgi:hypothetical protein
MDSKIVTPQEAVSPNFEHPSWGADIFGLHITIPRCYGIAGRIEQRIFALIASFWNRKKCLARIAVLLHRFLS